MKWTYVIIGLIGITACNSNTENKTKVSINNNASQPQQNIQYSEKEIISFLDSIGCLKPDIWSKNLTFEVDSTLNGQIKLNHKLSSKDFEKLKSTIRSGVIDIDFAKRIFPILELDSNLIDIENNKLPIGFYSFDNNEKDFNEFSISIGIDGGLFWSNDVYFFKENKVIAKHKIYHRYGLELKHYKNEINETVIYYKVCFASGTGVWWHQYNFYGYNKEKLIPLLTEIENINLQPPWRYRSYWIESKILNTNPLKLKFVFYNKFIDSLNNEIDFINDSTEVVYGFDRLKKVYEPKFRNNKLNRLKLLTYFHTSNDLLFVNLNYDRFKKEINSKDKRKRQTILNYLNDLKHKFKKE